MKSAWTEILLAATGTAILVSAPFFTYPWPQNFFLFLYWVVACIGLIVFVLSSFVNTLAVILTPMASQTERPLQQDLDLISPKAFGGWHSLIRIALTSLLLFCYWYGGWNSNFVMGALIATLANEVICTAYASMWVSDFERHFLVD